DKEARLKRLFADANVTGSITLYDPQVHRWIYSDPSDADRATLPASTFKIVHSLIALKTGMLRTDQILRWDGKPKSFKGQVMPVWNADTNMEQAFRNSTIWFYERLSRQIPRKTYADTLAT